MDGGGAEPARELQASGAKGSSPAEVLLAGEEMDLLMASLPKTLRPVALLVLSGHSASDIAEQFGCSSRTIERRIKQLGITLTQRVVRSGENP
jgi:DNA-directed RNA polymerase specialized sigma24 family protein